MTTNNSEQDIPDDLSIEEQFILAITAAGETPEYDPPGGFGICVPIDLELSTRESEQDMYFPYSRELSGNEQRDLLDRPPEEWPDTIARDALNERRRWIYRKTGEYPEEVQPYYRDEWYQRVESLLAGLTDRGLVAPTGLLSVELTDKGEPVGNELLRRHEDDDHELRFRFSGLD